MTNSHKLPHRLIYFGVTGVSAATVHVITVSGLVTFMQVRPLVANIFAFLLAFNVSFLGHRYFTFAKLHNQKQLSLPHFFLVASSAGVINELLYFLLLDYTPLGYLIALIIVLGLVSVYSFMLSRFWACR
ncbi:GtrA family protein [Legionella antarctica]|uniref:GtrA family protein n=1 Tax=Legionella antarctica TaxID=2708020 RepID=UPI001563F2A3|nr:GtrA family protein [Legionella antarctica]